MSSAFASAPVARLATVTPEGRPHVVPIVFAAEGDIVYTAVDGKPKSTQRLRRLANITANPSVSVLVDHYAADWSQLWWVRADGMATVLSDGAEFDHALRLLRTKYPQYESVSLDGPVIRIAVTAWARWPA